MKILPCVHRPAFALGLVFLACIPGTGAPTAPETSATGSRQPAESISIVRNLDTFGVFLRNPRPWIAFGPDFHARGGHVTVSPHSAVGYRHWFRVTCTYGAAFFGLAILEELKLQESGNERE
jgi:hypothetical protein